MTQAEFGPSRRNSDDPKAFDALAAEHRAWAVLSVLRRQPGHRSNSSVLSDWVSLLGLDVSLVQLVSELEALQRHLLVDIEQVGDLAVLTLTARGAEYLEGRIEVEGLARLPLGCPY